jgi:hypothetical protein
VVALTIDVLVPRALRKETAKTFPVGSSAAATTPPGRRKVLVWCVARSTSRICVPLPTRRVLRAKERAVTRACVGTTRLSRDPSQIEASTVEPVAKRRPLGLQEAVVSWCCRGSVASRRPSRS